MGISFGKVMAVDGEACIFNTSITRIDRLSPYVAGNTSGGTGRRSGNSFWEGFYHTYAIDSANNQQPARFPNDSFSLAAAFDSGAQRLAGTARCNLLEAEWPIEQGAYVTYKVGFLCNGALTPEDTAVTDSSIPSPMPTEGLLLKLSENTQGNISYMRLRITANCCPYCNSSTAGQWMHKEGDLDVVAQWRQDTDNPVDWPTIGDHYIVKMYVTATTFWELKWMRIRGVEPMYQDRREPDRITSVVITAGMNASDSTSLGYIKDPATTTKWNS